MATVHHVFQSNRPDGGDDSLLQPSHWNSPHQILGLDITDTPQFAGLILASPDGSWWNISVTNDGNISADKIIAPTPPSSTNPIDFGGDTMTFNDGSEIDWGT